ncbi:MAG: hypothetical protein ACREXT_20100, partial [Gammaproteobacteria bacterium]
GLWIALAVIAEAWSLYREPAQIERFALAIEEGSHLDRTLSSASLGRAVERDAEANINDGQGSTAEPTPLAPPSFRLSYFVAWIIVLMLMLLIGRLAIGAVKVGGELVLYDRHIKRFVRELLREAGGKVHG